MIGEHETPVYVGLLDQRGKSRTGWLSLWRTKGARPELTQGVRILAPVLASYADTSTGQRVYPSTATLAEASDLAESTVNAAKKVLEREGWIVRTRAGGGHVGDTAGYRLAVPAWLWVQVHGKLPAPDPWAEMG